MTESSRTVKEAFMNAALIKMGNTNYQDIMIDQRMDGPFNSGSSYDLTAEDIKRAVEGAEWKETSHVDVAPNCRVFVTEDIPYGRTGIMDIANMPDDTTFYAIDPKHTGMISIGAAYVPKTPEDKTYLIIGPEYIDGEEKSVVYTFHPGEPVQPSTIKASDQLYNGMKLTKEQVLSFGFGKAKYMSPEMIKEYERGYMFEKSVRNGTEQEKIEVAKDRGCSIELLRLLSKDQSPAVRLEVAKNESTPAFILLEMADDKTPSAPNQKDCLAIGDYATSLLLRIASDDGRHLPQGQKDLQDIAESNNRTAKEVMALNNCTPLPFLIDLTKDSDRDVVLNAQRTLTEISIRANTSNELRTNILENSNLDNSEKISIDARNTKEGGIIDPNAAISAAKAQTSMKEDKGEEKENINR